MSNFNAVGQYAGTHKVWDHVGNILPAVEYCEGQRPSHDRFMAAAWLPVKFYDKYYEEWCVILPGKVLSCDPDGRLMPAQYGLGGATVVYTQQDVDAGVIDIRTGVALTSAGIGTVTLTNVDGSTSSFMGRSGEGFGGDGSATTKWPIGVCWAPIYQAAGDGSLSDDGFNPAYYRYHNHNLQHKVCPLCDYVLKLPLIPGRAASESLSNAWTSSALTFDGAGGWRTRTFIQATARYNASTGLYPCLNTYNVCAVALNNKPLATNTTRTPMSSTVTGLLLNEVSAMSAILASGDYWVDYEVGVVFVYSSGGSTLPTVGPADTITYYHYAAATGTVSAFGCVVATTTLLRPGDFLKFDANSNFVRANPAIDSVFEIIGQVLAIDNDHPKDYLDRVRTCFSPALQTSSVGTMSNQVAGSASAGRGQLDQLTGSATGGIPTLVTYAGGADQIVVVNLIHR